MGSASSGQTIDHLTKLAADYGPFLFAILFSLLIPSRVHSSYRSDLAAFPNPSAEQSQIIRENRVYFRATWLMGFVLVGISVMWWVYQNWHVLQKADNYFVAYTGVIYGVDQGDELDGALGQPIEVYRMNSGADHFYRYTVLEKQPVTGDERLMLRWVSAQQTHGASNTGGGFGGRTVAFLMKPSVSVYEFKSDGNSVQIQPSEQPK